MHDYYIVNLCCSNESIPNREDAVMCPVDRIQQYFGSEVAPWIPWDHGQLGRLRFFRSGQVKYLKDTCWGLEHFNLLDEALLFTVFLIDLYAINYIIHKTFIYNWHQYILHEINRPIMDEALYFAWLNHFTLWLLAPAVVGLLCYLRMWLGEHDGV